MREPVISQESIGTNIQLALCLLGMWYLAALCGYLKGQAVYPDSQTNKRLSLRVFGSQTYKL